MVYNVYPAQMLDRHFANSDVGTEERGIVHVKGKGDMQTYWFVKKT